MKILEKEIGLREETRTLEQARPAMAGPDYNQRAEPLATTQADLADRVAGVIDGILELPEGAEGFPREIALLSRVQAVMYEAHELLDRPHTGPDTIAAETEVIELLLQARRINPKGGGGGGGNSPGGGSQGETDEAALALIGSGAERHAQTESRTVEQAPGVTGGELPAEFRRGLDAYFYGLERERRDGAE